MSELSGKNPGDSFSANADDLKGECSEMVSQLRAELELAKQELGRFQQLQDAEVASLRYAHVLLETVTEPAVLIDRDGIIVASNEATANRLGSSRSEIIGRDLFSFFSPDVADERRRICDRVMRVGMPFRYEDGFDGRVYDVNLRPIRDVSGEVTHLAVFVCNITEQADVKLELQRSREQYRTIIDNFPNGMVIVLDSDFRFILTGGEGFSKLGFSATDLVGKSLRDIFPADICVRIESSLSRVFRGGSRHFDLNYHGYDWLVYAVPSGGGGAAEVSSVTLLAIDITQRNRTENAYRESEARLQVLVENLPFDFWAMDPSGRYIMQNAACRDRWGSVVGKKVEEVDGVAAEFLQMWREHGRDALAGKVVNADFTTNHGGEPKAYSTVIAPVKLGDAITGVLCVAFDITLRRRAEEELRRHRDRLDELVTERTAELTRANSDLMRESLRRRQAQESARQRQAQLSHIDRLNTIGELATGLAHEINQPLCAISTYADSCLRLMKSPECDIEEVFGILTDLSDQACRAGRIIRRIRKFARKQEFERKPIDLREIVENAIVLVEHDSKRCGVPIDLDLPGDLPLVLADDLQIEQVLLNLMLNALEVLAEVGPIDPLIMICAVDDGSGSIELRLIDNGKKVDEDMLETIFDAFYTTRPRGLGLGLAISRSIISDHAGKLWASANESGGMTFHFTLPKAR